MSLNRVVTHLLDLIIYEIVICKEVYIESSILLSSALTNVLTKVVQLNNATHLIIKYINLLEMHWDVFEHETRKGTF